MMLVATVVMASPAVAQGTVSLRTERAQVLAKYVELSRLSMADRKQTYEPLDPRVKEDLWSVHVEKYLAGHPALSPGQRAVIFSFLGVIQSGAMEQPSWEPGWQTGVDQPFRVIENQARELFSPAEAQAIFATLGPVERTASGAVHAFFRQPVDSCECSTESPWCDWLTNPDPSCHNGGCLPQHGCGTGWSYDCNGMCGT